MNIEWKLSCSKNDALRKIDNSIVKSSIVGWYKIHGKIDRNSFSIWEKAPRWGGKYIAIGKGEILEKGNDASILKATIAIVWPFSYFRFSSLTLAAIIILAFASWSLSLFGDIFQKYEVLSNIFFPIGMVSILVLILSFIRYLGESEKNDLHKFLRGIFSNYIQ